MRTLQKQVVCFLLIILCMIGLALPAAAKEADTPIEVSFDHREAVKDKITAFIQEHTDKTPSVAITVFDSKQDICNITYGYADISNKIEANESTVYEWGSVSKLLVWVSAMQLYEQGKLDLEADIRMYLPADFFAHLKYDEPITMIDLMNHSAGFQETVSEIETSDINDIITLDRALKTTEPAQVAHPGDTVSYSNWGAALGGYVVSCISGMDYAEYVKKNIFDKLGMEHTYLKPDASDNEWAAEQRHKLHSYAVEFPDEGMEDMGECRAYINLYPAGSAGGTISDMTLFAKALLSESKDCPLFEKEDTLDLMLSPSWIFGNGTPRICHGLFYTLYGDGLYGHGGNTKACSSDLQLDLKNKTGYVMMINVQSDQVYTKGLPELLYGESAPKPQTNFTPIDISGHYRFGRSAGGEGMLRILSPFEDGLNIYKDGSGYTSQNGIERIEQISDTFYEFSLINGTKRYYAVKKTSDGEVAAIESFQAIDLTKISDTQYYCDWAMIILFVLSVAVMAVLFIIHLIRSRKYRHTELARYKRTECVAALMSFIIVVMAAVIGFNDRFFFYGGIAIHSMIAIILCAAAICEAAMLIRCRFFGKDEKPRRLILLNIESLCCLLTIMGIVYWNLYQFWGY